MKLSKPKPKRRLGMKRASSFPNSNPGTKRAKGLMESPRRAAIDENINHRRRRKSNQKIAAGGRT